MASAEIPIRSATAKTSTAKYEGDVGEDHYHRIKKRSVTFDSSGTSFEDDPFVLTEDEEVFDHDHEPRMETLSPDLQRVKKQTVSLSAMNTKEKRQVRYASDSSSAQNNGIYKSPRHSANNDELHYYSYPDREYDEKTNSRNGNRRRSTLVPTPHNVVLRSTNLKNVEKQHSHHHHHHHHHHHRGKRNIYPPLSLSPPFYSDWSYENV